jgi:hypothetical protein
VRALGLPPLRPLARAAVNPAVVRSRIKFRSNSARAPIPPAGGGINVLRQAFKPNPSLLKSGHGGNEVRQGSSQLVKPPNH